MNVHLSYRMNPAIDRAWKCRVNELEKMSVVSSVGIPNQSLHNVFVYGSLLADDVVQVLLKRVPTSAPATLSNHHRFSIKGRVYPAILPVEDKKVTGRVCNIRDPVQPGINTYASLYLQGII